MNISIKNNGKVVFDKFISNIKTDDTDVVEILTKFDNKDIIGLHKQICLENFKISCSDIEVFNTYKIDVDFTGETIEMIFVLQGKFKVLIPELKINYNYQSNEHNLFYYANAKRSLYLKKGKHRIFNINLSLKYFNQFCPKCSKFNNNIEQKKTDRLQLKNQKITPKILEIIKEIYNSEWKGHYRKIHINARVLELLLLQLNQLQKEEKKIKIYFADNDQRIVRINDYITQNYNEPLSLEFLSKKFGTNEFTLKKNFKATYNNTVFGYIADLKMEKAKELLIYDRLSIGEVSEKIGYKNPQHFSTAFKKKFGTCPSKANTLT